MELRAFGNTDMKVSPLGFGVMRLPMKDGGKTVNSNTIDQVDVDTSIAMIRAAIDGGDLIFAITFILPALRQL